MSLGLRRSRASRVALAGALSSVVGGVLATGLLLIGAGPAAAAPTPSPAPAPAPGPVVDLLPGILPPVPLPVIDVAPVVGAVVSTVNGLGDTVHRTLDGVLAPAGRRASTAVPTSVTARPKTAPPKTAAPGTASTNTASTPSASTGTRPARSGASRAAAHVRNDRRSVRVRTTHVSGSTGGSGAARTGVAIAAAPNLPHSPAALVRETADAVMHPGRALLAIIAITVVCALGMLALVGSLGRRDVRTG